MQCRVLLAIAISAMSLSALSQEPTVLRDPHLRDEDISATTVTSTVARLSDGTYEYKYNLAAGTLNKGRVLSFGLDISCTLVFEGYSFPEAPDPHFTRDLALGMHVPLQPYTLFQNGAAANPSISVISELNWLVGLSPGRKFTGLRLLSPAPPGPRQFRLTVSMDTADVEADGSGWDYSDTEDDPTVPWESDFEVRGITTAPACAKAPPVPPARFLGNGNESNAINSILSYSAPLMDQLHVPSNQKSLELHVFYSGDIDAKTFRVEPGNLKGLFHPAPGTDEVVQVPLKEKKKIVLKLEAKAVSSSEPRKQDPLDHSFVDRDVFTIRRD